MSKLFAGLAGGDPWAQAAQIAQTMATSGVPEGNVDPVVRMAFEDLARVADLHVRQAPGLRLPPQTSLLPVTRSTWAQTSVSTYRPFFERFGQALTRPATDHLVTGDSVAADPLSAMFGQMFQSMGPMMVAMSAGSMIGHLAQMALGQYDLPVPRPTDEVLVVPSAIDDAAAEWAVPLAEMRLWVMIHELVAHAILCVPHVRDRLDTLFIDFATAFRLDSPALTEQFENLTDFSKIGELAETFNDPGALFAMMRTPTHDLLVPQLDALVAVVLGAIDYLMTRICATLIPRHAEIRVQFANRTANANPADRFMEHLLGLDITIETIERGRRFVAGVVDRIGDDGLIRLWRDELDFPTPAEVNAPGLWIARIGLDPELPGGGAIDVPDDLSGLDDLP
ncbi:MAG: zinc-dependent metalloprotease [Actinomycetota bacterium]|nr:zinc-dependent metalloprotease [Actinomycetota bacterium]